MARQIIIHLPRIDEPEASWVVADETGRLVGEVVRGTLGDAAAAVEGRRATLVVPGDDVLLAEVEVPATSLARAQQAVPYALEEQLADDVDALHFALGARGKSESWPVAVIDRARMTRIVEACAGAGLRPATVVPEPLALPRETTPDAETVAWTALVDGEGTVVRLGDNGGFASDVSMLPLMLDGARRELPEDSEVALTLYHTAEARLPELPPELAPETRPVASRLALHASALAKPPRVNLLQGEYSPRQRFDRAWRPWRWTAALAACLALLLVAGRWLDLRRLEREEAVLDAAIAETFSRALPGTRMVRPRDQVEKALARAGQGAGESFITHANQIALSLATQPQTELRSIGYRDGRFDLDLTTDALPTLDALKGEIESRGSLSMTVQSANREDNAVRGRVRVQ